MKFSTKIKAIVILLILTSCTNDSPDDLIPVKETQIVTYSNTVKSIIQNNCVSCHAETPQNGAPMALTSYALVKDAVLNRGLIDRISREQGAPGMMPNGGTRLPQAVINQVIQWQNDGLLE
ncbi:c-type cytochrome [Flavobacterium chuncheonense]|uniref:C-type cytochrome n=1 Tax=Flavobacterium chuncheonense TaxID=2026653 RepID=A0ABW5YQ73_9FLAO